MQLSELDSIIAQKRQSGPMVDSPEPVVAPPVQQPEAMAAPPAPIDPQGQQPGLSLDQLDAIIAQKKQQPTVPPAVDQGPVAPSQQPAPSFNPEPGIRNEPSFLDRTGLGLGNILEQTKRQAGSAGGAFAGSMGRMGDISANVANMVGAETVGNELQAGADRWRGLQGAVTPEDQTGYEETLGMFTGGAPEVIAEYGPGPNRVAGPVMAGLRGAAEGWNNPDPAMQFENSPEWVNKLMSASSEGGKQALSRITMGAVNKASAPYDRPTRAAVQSAQGGAEAHSRGEDWKQGAALGVAELATGGGNRGVSNLFKRKPKVSPSTASVKPPPMNDAPPQPDVGPLRTQEPSGLLDQFGNPIQSKKGGPPPGETKTRQFIENTVQKSAWVPEDAKKRAMANPRSQYEQLSNAETYNKAVTKVETDAKSVEREFLGRSELKAADHVAEGEALIDRAVKRGDQAAVDELVASLGEKLTNYGQGVQAAKIMKRFTPAQMLIHADRKINKWNEKLTGKKKIKLTESESAYITQKMEEAGKLPDGRKKDVLIAEAQQVIANKEPSTLGDKIKGARRIGMLLNPKTLLARNPLGNTIMYTADRVADLPASVVDKILSTITGKREVTMSLGTIKQELKGFGRGAKHAWEDYRKGIDTTKGGNDRWEIKQGQTFKNSVMRELDDFTTLALKMGDRPFYEAAHSRRMGELKKLGNKSQIEMEADAHKYALDKTFQNDSGASKLLSKVRNGMNIFGIKGFGAGDVVVPFVKTPANLLDKAIEFSPLGATKAAKYAYDGLKKGGEFNQFRFSQSMGRSVTGSGVAFLGYTLAQAGLVTGDRKMGKKGALDKSQGGMPYSFRGEEGNYSFDWAQPWSVPFAVGVDMYRAGIEGNTLIDAMMKGAESGVNTLVKQSLLLSLARFFNAQNPAAGFKRTLLDLPLSFIPTASGQVAKLTDTKVRDTWAPDDIGRVKNRAMAKIPGLRQKLPAKVNVLGEEIEAYKGMGTFKKAAQIFIEPHLSRKKDRDVLLAHMEKVKEKTGSSRFVPSFNENDVNFNGKTYKFKPEERTKFQKRYGRYFAKEARRSASKNPASWDAEEKKLNKIKNKAMDYAKQYFAKDRGLTK